ncbi:S-layer homology domain-containing protein [Sporosarcina obsidiansis]|uniref:S-layer homology domain-containing protein n=1 Tax=Sporosarcina obsidiansis TaxID=2660748 RepID=UPI00129ABD90|nr:S-layer homology domain-containing protein [Sporosarcina obsidiansis]
MRKWTTRIAMTALFFICFIHSASAQTIDAKYSDVSNQHWAKDEIMQLDEMTVLEGDRDMQFRPEAPLTKGQAALSLSHAFSAEPSSKHHLFSDVEWNSEQERAALIAVENGWLEPSKPGIFGTDEPMKREELWDALVAAFKLKHNGRDVLPEIWPSSSDESSISSVPSIKIVNAEDFLNNETATVTRASFAKLLHRLLLNSGLIEETKSYQLSDVKESKNYLPIKTPVHLEKVSFDEHPIYLRSAKSFKFQGHEWIDNDFSKDNIYEYSVGEDGAIVELTVRSFDNGDEFLFSKLTNPSAAPVTVDVLQKENDVATIDLYRFDRYPIKRTSTDLFNTDMTSYPTGVLRFMKTDGSVEERMVGQSYISKQLSLTYDNGGKSYMRELLAEKEALSYVQVGQTLLSVHTLHSQANDIVDHWYLDADHPLFASNEHMVSWMKETSQYYKKRNSWYTAGGPYNKMVTSTEPMPETGQGYGRTLLMLKEDRALTLYHQQKDRYFKNLVYNAFVNLKNYKEDKTYWETEVTSTYLKDLYDIHAPFIDTRFNEQIALFYYNSGSEFGISESNEPLRNYADLLASQKEKGNVTQIAEDAYYIADYFPINQKVKTHTSMNHALGGMNILLMAYQEFHDPKYLETARAIQKAIALQKDEWIRDNGDIWYRIAPDLTYKGEDYKHLTLEDLIDSYQLWQQVDPTYLPVLREMIATKSSFLSNENLGYTTKIKNGLKQIGLMEYLPKGKELTDAL